MNTNALLPLAGQWPNDRIESDRSGVAVLGAMVFGPAGMSIYESMFKIDEAHSKCIQEFAAANGWKYEQRTSDYRQTKYAGHPPAWLGYQFRTTQPVFAHQISGEIAGFPAKMFVGYTAAAAQTKQSDTTRTNRKSYIKVSLPKIFPQMVLDSNKNDRGITGSIPSSFKTDQKLQLEGDFSDHFDFYSPVGLHVNTLTVLAPNFMQIVKDSSHTFDLEFFGNELILVTNEPIYTPEVMIVAVQALEEQLRYLQRLMNSWDYQPTRLPFDMLAKTAVQGSMIKIGPIRLSPAQLLLVLLLGFVLYAVLILVLKHFFPGYRD